MDRKTAVVLLAALAGCQPDLAGLEPKTAAECGAAAKPCGWKCVPLDDPSTGCGRTDSCSPCPVDQHEVGVCGPANACQTVCAAGWGDCNTNPADGCERPLLADQSNCGACGRQCDSTIDKACVDGYCLPTSVSAAFGVPTGIAATPSGAVYALDTGAPPAPALGLPGTLLRVDTVTPSWVMEGLGAPVWRLVATDAGGLYAIGTNGGFANVWAIDPAVPTATEATNSSTAIIDLAVGVPNLWIAPDASIDLRYSSMLGPATGTIDVGGQPRGIAQAITVGVTPVETWVYFATAAGGGTVRRILDGAPPTLDQTWAAIGLGGVSRVAAHDFGAFGIVAWTTLQDGGVTVMLVPDGEPVKVYARGVASSWMDVWVDDQGVYWTDYDAGTVGEIRYDSTRVVLASGVAPLAVTSTPTHVFFTDARGLVIRSPK
ncbi:MAG TPA: hypothetical protein VLS93_03170 [Anaeromyxobacteraceae bacterium]|nr:hypothetical protein [Anaeromyxobacteraceae bacterium]